MRSVLQQDHQEGVISGRHVGLDSCPIASVVRENNLKTTLRQMNAVQRTFKRQLESVSGDTEYDTEAILKHIVHVLKAKPFIPYHPRNTRDKGGFRREGQSGVPGSFAQ